MLQEISIDWYLKILNGIADSIEKRTELLQEIEVASNEEMKEKIKEEFNMWGNILLNYRKLKNCYIDGRV